MPSPTLQRLIVRPLERRLRNVRRRLASWWRRSWPTVLQLGGGTLVLLWAIQAAAVACHAPPSNPNDLCEIFGDKRSWYRATRRSFEEWGVPEAVQLAVIYQESSFRSTIRPPRRRILWILPWRRPTSAKGYSQALEGTWREYQERTDRPHARRDHFADAAHFVGWYGDQLHRITGVAKNDAYGLYLAYHEGPGGYRRGSYNRKPWLIKTARRVEARARRYQEQYDACRERLEAWWIFW